MVFKVICLLFYIVDMFLTVIDVTRSFIITRCKIGGGKNVKLDLQSAGSSPNLTYTKLCAHDAIMILEGVGFGPLLFRL